METSAAPPPVNGERKRIVRATARIWLDAADLAVNRTAHLKREGNKRACGGLDAGCRACQFPLALRYAQRQATTAANTCIRRLWRADGEAADALLAAGEWPPRTNAVWPPPKLDLYRIARAAAIDLATGITATISHAVFGKWRQTRWDALVKQICSPPHYRTSMSLPVREQSFRLTRDGSTFYLAFSLRAGRRAAGYEWTIPLEFGSGKATGRTRFALAQIAAGAWKAGDCRIEEDRRKRGRWMVRLSYQRLVDAKIGKEGAINRGMRCFLAAVTEDGDQQIFDGYRIIAHLKQIQARRREYQYDGRISGRSGRGRVRKLRPIESLQAAGERWRQTQCQTIARQYARWFEARGVARVFIEDFSGIRNGEPEKLVGGKYVWDLIQEWPCYQLQTRLVSCLEEIGIESVLVSPEYISQTCPICGIISPDNVDLVRHRFKCIACGWNRHLDVAAAMNVLARGRERLGGSPPPVGPSDGDRGSATASGSDTGTTARARASNPASGLG